MSDVVVLVGQLSLPVKLSWLLWLAWCVVQIAWYRRAKVVAPAVERSTQARLGDHRVEPVLSAAPPAPPEVGNVRPPVERKRRVRRPSAASKVAVGSIGASAEKAISLG